MNGTKRDNLEPNKAVDRYGVNVSRQLLSHLARQFRPAGHRRRWNKYEEMESGSLARARETRATRACCVGTHTAGARNEGIGASSKKSWIFGEREKNFGKKNDEVPTNGWRLSGQRVTPVARANGIHNEERLLSSAANCRASWPESSTSTFDLLMKKTTKLGGGCGRPHTAATSKPPRRSTGYQKSIASAALSIQA